MDEPLLDYTTSRKPSFRGKDRDNKFLNRHHVNFETQTNARTTTCTGVYHFNVYFQQTHTFSVLYNTLQFCHQRRYSSLRSLRLPLLGCHYIEFFSVFLKNVIVYVCKRYRNNHTVVFSTHLREFTFY